MRMIHRECGLASVEAALFLIVFLALIAVLFEIAGLMIAKLYVVNESRLAAWTSSVGLPTSKFSLLTASTNLDTPILTKVKTNDSDRNADLIASMRAEGCKKYRRPAALTQVINQDTRGIHTGTANSLYFPSRRFPKLYVNIESTHGLVANRIWERQMLPLGYDQYMKKRLNSRVLYTDLFPKSNKSAKVYSGCK